MQDGNCWRRRAPAVNLDALAVLTARWIMARLCDDRFAERHPHNLSNYRLVSLPSSISRYDGDPGVGGP